MTQKSYLDQLGAITSKAVDVLQQRAAKGDLSSEDLEDGGALKPGQHDRKIIHREGKYCIVDGDKTIRCFESREEAETALEVSKGLPAGQAEAGIHVHNLRREDGETHEDGAHQHLFAIALSNGEQILVPTFEDGEHVHPLPSSDADASTPNTGEHSHTVVLPDGTEIMTGATSSMHDHDLQVVSTGFDGSHSHSLQLPDDEAVMSLMPGDFWKLMGGFATSSGPAPPSSFLAELSEHAHGAIAALREMHTRSSTSEAEPSPEQTGTTKNVVPTGTFPSLKIPDPSFILERLQAKESAGLLSKRRRLSRVGKSQVLLNQLTPLGLTNTFVYGIISQGEPQAFQSIPELPEELRKGLDAFTLKDFEGEQDLYYLPLNLVSVFEPPILLANTPGGRRFASDVDLQKDMDKSSGQSVDKTIRQQGSQWCVFSSKTDRNFVFFDTRAEAEDRLRQVESFSKAKLSYTLNRAVRRMQMARLLQGLFVNSQCVTRTVQ
jgi:hypothetical protein